MEIICGVCGQEICVDQDLADGTHVRCPFCGEKSVYRKPSRIELPTERPQRGAPAAQPPSTTINPDLHIRRASSANPTPPLKETPNRILPRQIEQPKKSHPKQTVVLNFGWPVALLILLFGGFFAYKMLLSKAPAPVRDQPIHDITSVPQTDSKQDAEKLRLEREAQLERERLLAEQREREEVTRRHSQWYKTLLSSVSSSETVFAADVAKARTICRENGSFFIADERFVRDGILFEFVRSNDVLCAVNRFSARDLPQCVPQDEWNALTNGTMYIAFRPGAKVELWGTGSNIREVDIPRNQSISLSQIELGSLEKVIRALRLRNPSCRYRLSLVNANRKLKLPIAIVPFDARLSPREVDEAVDKLIVKRRQAQLGKNPPKMKKFTPTVVFYGGDIIRKDIKGVTSVPRQFTQLGTKHRGYVRQDTYEQAYAQWSSLRDEALRQERQAAEVECANQYAREEYERSLSDQVRRAVSQEEREAVLSSLRLLVERSLTKLDAESPSREDEMKGVASEETALEDGVREDDDVQPITASESDAKRDTKPDYKDQKEARLDLVGPVKSSPATQWLSTANARGRTHYSSSWNWDWGWVDVITTHAGAVLAFPDADFEILKEFTYKSNRETLKGLLVCVPISVHYPSASKPPSEELCRKTVKNLIEVGMQVPKNSGRPGRLLAIKKSVALRYGAKSVEPVYDECEDGRVKLIAWGCDEKRARESITSMQYEGQVAR